MACGTGCVTAEAVVGAFDQLISGSRLWPNQRWLQEPWTQEHVTIIGVWSLLNVLILAQVRKLGSSCSAQQLQRVKHFSALLLRSSLSELSSLSPPTVDALWCRMLQLVSCTKAKVLSLHPSLQLLPEDEDSDTVALDFTIVQHGISTAEFKGQLRRGQRRQMFVVRPIAKHCTPHFQVNAVQVTSFHGVRNLRVSLEYHDNPSSPERGAFGLELSLRPGAPPTSQQHSTLNQVPVISAEGSQSLHTEQVNTPPPGRWFVAVEGLYTCCWRLVVSMEGSITWQPPRLLSSGSSVSGVLMSELRRELAHTVWFVLDKHHSTSAGLPIAALSNWGIGTKEQLRECALVDSCSGEEGLSLIGFYRWCSLQFDALSDAEFAGMMKKLRDLASSEQEVSKRLCNTLII